MKVSTLRLLIREAIEQVFEAEIKYNVGDRVEIDSSANGGIGTIEISDHPNYAIKFDQTGTTDSFHFSDLRPFSDEEEAEKNADINTGLEENDYNKIIEQILPEGEDRCKRIADRKYDKPSAYKSGAIVRCRKGDIWKDIKEDQVNELNIQHKTKLGSEDSAEGETYDLKTSPDKVVKKYTQIHPETKYAQYEFMNKYPELFVKIYKVTPKYIVMEKVKVPIEGLEELQQFINKDLNINFVQGDVNNNRYASDIINATYNELKDNKNEMFMSILSRVKQKNQPSLTKLLIKIYNFLLRLKKQIPQLNKYWLDIHSDNIGEDTQGNLKLFDIMYEEEWADEDDNEDELAENKKETLHKWFQRSGPKGKEKGWVDCNAPDGKGGYKACGRKEGESRSKYPACRPTPAGCKRKGKGKTWGKTK